MKKAKAQVSADLLIISAVVFMLFLFLFEIYANGIQSTRILATQLAAQRAADDVARAIDRAWLAGNGSVAHMSLPGSLPGGLPYNVSIQGRQVTLVYSAGEGARVAGAGMATSNVSAVNFTMGSGSERPLNVTNINGSIGVSG